MVAIASVISSAYAIAALLHHVQFYWTYMVFKYQKCNFRNYLSRFQNYLSPIDVFWTHRRETVIRPHLPYVIE
jgi:hypothetical protein